ncbi:MAG: C-GCAxxG-C-C family protein [Desulfobacteraceae bacterium]|jgi:C_GCAxxG_C_C family probable redox protein|nr:C-GCAxxG-C-C family protein [Desulfobacteraceae bacterium]
MSNQKKWQKRVSDLAERSWEVAAIRDRLNNLRQNGFSPKYADWAAVKANRGDVLDRVQLRAEEYEYLTHSCAKGAALALMEEFGLGSWDLTRAMSPFPGFGMTGGICGAVTGSLIALGLFFGSDDPEDYEGTGRTMTAARDFIARFKEELGTIMCPELQEDVVFGRYMDPRASQENFAAFQKAQGYEKCALLPGVGARLAAEVMMAGGGPARS